MSSSISARHESDGALPYTPAQRCEASEWFVVIRETEDPSPETLQAWMRWLETSEGNRLAFEAVERAWHQTSPSLVMAMPANDEIQSDRYDGTMSVAEWVRDEPAVANVPSTSGYRRSVSATRKRSVLRLVPWAAAAGIVLGIFVWRPAMDSLGKFLAPSTGEFTTRTGEHRDILLADGSRVSLGAKSRLAVNFSAQRRDLRLESGEAYFSVQKDRKRPFTVHALNGAITAIGTAFNVAAVGDRVTVTVTEGIVGIQDEDQRVSTTQSTRENAASTVPSVIRRVNSGQQVIFGAHLSVSSVEAASKAVSNERMRWREGWLVYRDEPLSYVLADVARYSGRHIEVGDEEIATLRFSGAVQKDNIDEWISALPESFPVTVNARDYRLIVHLR